MITDQGSQHHVSGIGSLHATVDGSAVPFDFGRMYLICREPVDEAFDIAKDLGEDKNVLLLSRYHPDLLERLWPDENFQSVWLCERNGKSNIHPSQLSKISNNVASYMEKHESPIVVLDGVEYLSAFNDFNRLQMFIETLNEMAMESHAILLIPLDSRSFDRRSIARLRRFAEVVC